MESIQVAIVDPAVLVCQSVANALQDVPGLTVVGHASTKRSALDLVQRLRPRVVLMEPSWPDGSGDRLILQLSAPALSCSVLGFGCLHNALRAARVMALGALGYVPKDAAPDELVSAIKTVAQGWPFFAAGYNAQHMQRWLDQLGDRLIDPVPELTAREYQVLSLVVQGGCNLDIGKHLGISPRTVEIHRANAMEKLHLRSLAEAVRFALRCGLLPQAP